MSRRRYCVESPQATRTSPTDAAMDVFTSRGKWSLSLICEGAKHNTMGAASREKRKRSGIAQGPRGIVILGSFNEVWYTG